jgi:predicted RNA polymerase sigma factor
VGRQDSHFLFPRESGRIIASLISIPRPFDLAEEALPDALTDALVHRKQ